jgi:hypothetical protein
MFNHRTSAFFMALLTIAVLGQCSSSEGDEDMKPVAPSDPPFNGTIFLDPDIILPSDPTAFVEIVENGQEERTVYDRRAEAWVTINAFLFNASYVDGLSVEMQVNPEFETVQDARTEAEKYARVIGQLPAVLRTDVQTATIHKGLKPFGGGNDNLLIHTGQSVDYENQGILEETFVHEATHTSLDSKYADAPEWIAAQEADKTFISTYARDFAQREDVAESFLLYFALRQRNDRISAQLATTIEQTIPNRILFFDSQQFNWFPQ